MELSRDYEKLHADVCKKSVTKEIIWQPRIRCWYDDRLLLEGKLPGEYEGKSIVDVYKMLDCSSRPYHDFAPAYKRVDDSRVKRYTKALNDLDTAHIVETPVGTLTEITQKVEKSDREKRLKWRIETPEDLAIATWLEESSTWEFDHAIYEKAHEMWKGICAPTMYTPRINIQELYICDMGVEEATYALADYEEEVEKYFAAKDANHMRLMHVINDSPIDIINFGDNLHCGTLPPYLFEKYILPVYQERCEVLHRTNKFVSAHWDGDTKLLLQYAKQTGLDGIEAITPKPQGDVTIEEIKEGLGDDVYLLDGVAAILFDAEYTEDDLIAQTEQIIKLFGHKVILGISDEISYNGDIERVRIVGDIVKKYNANITREK